MRAYLAAPLTARWSWSTFRAALWAHVSLRVTARRLSKRGITAEVPAPPHLMAGSRRGVEAVLRRSSPTCLERSLVLQRWLFQHGVPCEVVIGVKRGASGVQAHAWLDVEQGQELVREFTEIHRLPPR